MKANMSQWLSKARGGHSSLADWFSNNVEPFRLEIDNRFTFYFIKKNEKETIVSITYDGRRAYEWHNCIDFTLDDFVLPTNGIEKLVDEAERKASELKKAGLIQSYPTEVYNILWQFRV